MVWNEAAGKDTFATNNKLKALITDPTIRIEKKGMQPYRVQNCMNLFIFSTNMTPVPISSDDRRFQVFQIKEVKPQDYYVKLANAIQDRSILLGLVEVLKKRDIVGYDFAKNRVKTDYYQSLVSGNINTMDMFIANQFNKEVWLANNELIQKHEDTYHERANYYPQKVVYHQYQEYCEKKNWKDIGRNKFYHYLKTTYDDCMKFTTLHGYAHIEILPDKLLERLLQKQVLGEAEVFEVKNGECELFVEKI